jgi:ABC-2 type transport system ATP-binding protein
MDEVLRTEGLGRRFGPFQAVSDVTLSVRAGEVYGFLGLNGAGKTTTIRMLLGMIRPTSGRIRLAGRDVTPGKTGLWNEVGFLVETPYAYPELTVRENLSLVARLRLMKHPAGAVDRVIARLDLGAYADQKVRHLSLGNAQRLGLAKALVHSPHLLLLDEPSNGLDPAGIVEIRSLLRSLAREEGKTVFVSSHNLDEVSRFADRIGIIHGGRLVQELTLDEVAGLTARRLEVGTEDLPRAATLLLEAGYSPQTTGGTIRLDEPRAVDRPQDINALLVASGLVPHHLVVQEENLEQYFLRAIGRTGGLE